MVGLETRNISRGVASGGSGDTLPPITLEGTPDFGDRDDWMQWEGELEINELDIAASVMRHPAAFGASELELTQALLHDGWRERHARVKDALNNVSFLSRADIVQIDDFRSFSPYDDLPPSAA